MIVIDFLKKTFHIPKFATGGIIEKPIVYEEYDPLEFVVNQERLNEFIEAVRLNEERKTMKHNYLKELWWNRPWEVHPINGKLTLGKCVKLSRGMADTWFCSLGERKDNGI